MINGTWRKSSYSQGGNANCVEFRCEPTGDRWHKSSYSTSGGNCVEVAEDQQILMRDTQNRGAGHLAFPAGEWAAVLGEVKRGLE